MSYPPQGGGYPSDGDGYPDGNQQPQQYDLFDQQTSGPAYQGGYPQQPDPYGWGQAPQSPAGGYPQQGYQQQPPPGYQQPGQYQQQPSFTPQPPPQKSNTGLIATVVIGSLVLLLLVTGGLIMVSRNGGSGDGGNSGDGGESSTAQQDQKDSPKQVVQSYYDANQARDWEAALDLLSEKKYNQFKDVPDSDREAAADQIDEQNTEYIVGEERIIEENKKAEVDVTISSDAGEQQAALTLIVENDVWVIDDFGG